MQNLKRRAHNFEAWERYGFETEIGWRRRKTETLKKRRKFIELYLLKKEVIMPGFNQTGPMGQGSMTGRKMGKCTNFGAQGQEQTSNDAQDNTQNLSQGFGRGGMGRGMGRGMARGFGGGRGMGRGRGRGNRGGGFNN